MFLNNHLRFTILYHKDTESDLSRIVGFEVQPFSVRHKYSGAWNPMRITLSTCNPANNRMVEEKDEKQALAEGQEIIFTYDVKFKVIAPPSSSCIHATLQVACSILVLEHRLHTAESFNMLHATTL